MRLHYPISLEDFRTLRPPFELRAGKNAGFKGVLGACFLMAMLGVFCLAEGLGWQVGVFLIGLAGPAATAAYFYERRSVRRAQQQHEQKTALAYQHLHCRDERFFETDENGFTAKCNCGAVTRPWSELTGFSENQKALALGTKTGWQIIPKSAFPSPAALTEFRALISEKVNHGKHLTARHVDFKITRDDFRSARFLHLRLGGGWCGVAKALAKAVCIVCGCFVIAKAAHNSAITAGVASGIIGVPLLKFASNRRKLQFVPLRIYFDDNGLYLEDPVTQARKPWTQFMGYLESADLILLYSNPRLYRIIPKRVLVGQGAEFERMIKSKLRQFDYRKPLLNAHVTSVGAAQQA